MTDQMPQLGDVGFDLVLQVMENGAILPVTGATAIQFYLKKPNKSVVVRTGVVHNGALGQLRYTTVAGDLDQSGLWVAQAAFVLGTWDGRSSKKEFPVGSNL